ncbi:Restriction endonuclease [Psychrobacillus sp. OK028]|uniref:restriction endonuclease n=1 Tax=Psychrobacillus sp. OK028 TaxID=1884359 RepID=UPI000881DAF2|nr:restriction endonuclease [Psychrobacillus sp. OK028]SDO03065.1 Restriction endonuclease [Psychrobacillus sp. OK028]
MDNDIPMWKVYEWLNTKILHNLNNSINVKVSHNVMLTGLISEEKRQVDIFVDFNISGYQVAIDCKKYSNKVDIKKVESFIGMCEDLGVDKGIIIATKGFTKGAKKRIQNNSKIELQILDWKKAYKSIITELDYNNNLNDICTCCTTKDSIIPGILLWDSPYGVEEYDGSTSIYFLGECLKCNSKSIYCDPCGIIGMNAKYSTFKCDCCEREVTFK